MNEKAKAMLDAHVAHTLSQLDEASIQKTLEAESVTLQEWLKTIRIEHVTTKERVVEFVHEIIFQQGVSDELRKLLIQDVNYYAFAPWLKNYHLSDFVEKSDFDAHAEKLIAMHDLRNDAIHQVLHSQLYKQFITDVSYHVIKQYVTEENIVAKKVPGVSSLMKIGNKAMSMAAPKLEGAVEATVKKFIKENLGGTISFSEKLLEKSLSEGALEDLSQEIFKAMKDVQLDLASRYIKAEDITDAVDLLAASWDSFRANKAVREVLEKVVDRLFETASDKSLGHWYQLLRLDNPELILHLSKALAEALKPAITSGYLAERIQANLEPFYLSEAASEILKA